MKTFNKLFLSTFLLTTLVSAADKTYSFIGIQAAHHEIEKSSVQSVGIKYGKQTKKYRTSLSYSYGENSQNEYQTIMAQVDMGILTNTFKNSPIKPYAGLSFGIMQNDNKLLNDIDRGYLYGPNAGITYIFNDSFDFDLGYRYLKTSKLNEIDTISDVTLSVNYFY